MGHNIGHEMREVTKKSMGIHLVIFFLGDIEVDVRDEFRGEIAERYQPRNLMSTGR